MDNIRSSSHPLKLFSSQFRLDKRSYFFIQTINLWNSLLVVMTTSTDLTSALKVNWIISWLCKTVSLNHPSGSNVLTVVQDNLPGQRNTFPFCRSVRIQENNWRPCTGAAKVYHIDLDGPMFGLDVRKFHMFIYSFLNIA